MSAIGDTADAPHRCGPDCNTSPSCPHGRGGRAASGRSPNPVRRPKT